jgi:hypothetical protein
MSVLALYENRLTATDENITDSIDYTIEDIIRPAETPPTVQEIVLPRRIRSVKVLAVRRQLAQGTYDLNERLDAILERLLMDVTR